MAPFHRIPLIPEVDHPSSHDVEGSAGGEQFLDAIGVGRTHPGEHDVWMSYQFVDHGISVRSQRSRFGDGQLGQQKRQSQDGCDRQPGLDR